MAFSPARRSGALPLLRPVSEKVASSPPRYLAMQVSTLSVAVILGLQHWWSDTYLPVTIAVTFPAPNATSLAPSQDRRGLYTVVTLSLPSEGQSAWRLRLDAGRSRRLLRRFSRHCLRAVRNHDARAFSAAAGSRSARLPSRLARHLTPGFSDRSCP